MKVGILGSGFMGGTHARAYAKIKGVEVAAVSSQRLDKAQALAKEVGARATTDDMAIVNDPSIEAISNTLPTHLHAEFTIAALKAGKHVLLEKPFALTAAGCDGMIAAQKASGKILLVAHVLRFWGEYVSLVEFVRSGKIGKPHLGDRDAAVAIARLGRLVRRAREERRGGARSLRARFRRGKLAAWRAENRLCARAAVPSRPVEQCPRDARLWRRRGRRRGQRVHARGLSVHGGLEGHLRGRRGRVPVPRRRRQRRDGRGQFADRVRARASPTPSQGKPGDAYENQAAYFVDCVRNGRKPALGTPEQARLAVQTSEAARRSLETGAVVGL